jgi:hypothetical protein
MSKEIGNSVWPLKDQTNPQKSLAWNSVKYPWSLRDMRCLPGLPVKCDVYPRKRATPRIQCVFVFFLVFFNQSGHPDANRIQVACQERLSHGVFCFQDWLWGHLGQNTCSHANIYVSLSENKTKSYGKFCVKCDSKWYRMSLTNEARPR